MGELPGKRLEHIDTEHEGNMLAAGSGFAAAYTWARHLACAGVSVVEVARSPHPPHWPMQHGTRAARALSAHPCGP